MSDRLSIQTLSTEDVQNAIRDALRDGLDTSNIADFVARVDWSGTQTDRPAIGRIVGELEAREHEYSEGDLTRSAFLDYLLSLLPAEERPALARSA